MGGRVCAHLHLRNNSEGGQKSASMPGLSMRDFKSEKWNYSPKIPHLGSSRSKVSAPGSKVHYFSLLSHLTASGITSTVHSL